MKIPITKFLADHDTVNLTKDLSISLSKDSSPFNQPDGYSFSVVSMNTDAPHNGEMHPDGDEIVFVTSGKISVSLEFDETKLIEVNTGEGIVIPKVIWHKIHVITPAQLVNIVPGPSFEFRPINYATTG